MKYNYNEMSIDDLESRRYQTRNKFWFSKIPESEMSKKLTNPESFNSKYAYQTLKLLTRGHDNKKYLDDSKGFNKQALILLTDIANEYFKNEAASDYKTWLPIAKNLIKPKIIDYLGFLKFVKMINKLISNKKELLIILENVSKRSDDSIEVILGEPEKTAKLEHNNTTKEFSARINKILNLGGNNNTNKKRFKAEIIQILASKENLKEKISSLKKSWISGFLFKYIHDIINEVIIWEFLIK